MCKYPKKQSINNNNSNIIFQTSFNSIFLLRYNHTPLCKVAYNWLSATLTIYHEYLTKKKRKKKRNVLEKERASVDMKLINRSIADGFSLLKLQYNKCNSLLIMVN